MLSNHEGYRSSSYSLGKGEKRKVKFESKSSSSLQLFSFIKIIFKNYQFFFFFISTSPNTKTIEKNLKGKQLWIYCRVAGIINRGDSFRRRRSRSNSLAPTDPEGEEKNSVPAKEITSYTVAILGARGVGKTALISQFMTSECINAYDRQRGKSDANIFSLENSYLRYYVNRTNLYRWKFMV